MPLFLGEGREKTVSGEIQLFNYKFRAGKKRAGPRSVHGKKKKSHLLQEKGKTQQGEKGGKFQDSVIGRIEHNVRRLRRILEKSLTMT